MDQSAHEQLKSLETAGLRRHLRELETGAGHMVSSQGRGLVNFSSNDYLGLSTCPELKATLIDAAACYGVGSGSSRLVTGHHGPHEELEQTLARFKGTTAALAFSSGYATALGVIPAVIGAGDTVILDKLCHACLIDAAKLSGATLRVFPHNHLDKLQRLLRAVREKSSARSRVLIITESIFSMDGDAAPLREIVALKERYGAWLMVDEAHAVGVLGPQGRGLVAALGLEAQVDLQMGTLSKALGVHGGYVAASRTVIDLLINRARSLIYSTAPPAAIAATAEHAVRLVLGSEGEARRKKLEVNKTRLLSALNRESGALMSAAILPLIIGGETEALKAALELLEAGFLLPAIRYPTVSRGSARLRLTLSATHEFHQIEALVASLGHLMPEL